MFRRLDLMCDHFGVVYDVVATNVVGRNNDEFFYSVQKVREDPFMFLVLGNVPCSNGTGSDMLPIYMTGLLQLKSCYRIEDGVAYKSNVHADLTYSKECGTLVFNRGHSRDSGQCINFLPFGSVTFDLTDKVMTPDFSFRIQSELSPALSIKLAATGHGIGRELRFGEQFATYSLGASDVVALVQIGQTTSVIQHIETTEIFL